MNILRYTVFTISCVALIIGLAACEKDLRTDRQVCFDAQKSLDGGDISAARTALSTLIERNSQYAGALEIDIALAARDIKLAEKSLAHLGNPDNPELRAAKSLAAIAIAFAKSEKPDVKTAFVSLNKIAPEHRARAASLLETALERGELETAYRLGSAVAEEEAYAGSIAKLALTAMEN